MTRIETCKKCEKPFAVDGVESRLQQEYEDIDCPHCGDVWGKERTASVYSTNPLTPEQEKEYRSRKK
jgi:DNA-directed RNA polymerase subunit RPC12/RpoP